MKLVVFGATGRTGRLVVEQALAQGHQVTAFARDPLKMPRQDDRLRLVQGDIHEAARVAAAVAGREAVVCTLGSTRYSPKDIMEVGARHILAAMCEHGVRRLITLTGTGVLDANDQPQLANRAMGLWLKLVDGALVADAQRHAELIRASDRDWTIIRVTRLTDDLPLGTVRVGYVGLNTGMRITRADAASFMLKQLEDDSYLRLAPVISN
ncbi:MAG TPA: SDR family oxidoreductase [Chloroflexota bacterium]|nr:SDR family oxidoreductase [Chloroflexota bacterium]